MRKDLEMIKNDLGIDLKRDDYVAALWRHFARVTLLSTERALALFAETEAMDLGEPLDSDDVANIEEVQAEATEVLGKDSPAKWRDDQVTIEEFHLQRYGHLDHLKYLPSSGYSALEMLAHYLEWSLRPHFEKVRREGEVREVKEPLEAVCGPPVRLHNLSNAPIDYKLSPYCFTPQFRDGTIGYGLEYLYALEEHLDQLDQPIIILNPDWSEDDKSPESDRNRKHYDRAVKKLEALEHREHIRDMRGDSILDGMVPSAPGLVEFFEALGSRRRL